MTATQIQNEFVVGIDEVGRGCWAGPVVAGAVLLHHPIDGLRDSKKLSASKRALLAEVIDSEATCGLGWVTPAEVDTIGLTAAVALAMRRALEEIYENYDRIIIDGNYNFLPDIPRTETLVKADDLVPAVSAAGILAKVARDNYMVQQSLLYPKYGFDAHVGYGTARHIEALRNCGVTPLHRRSYKPVLQLLP